MVHGADPEEAADRLADVLAASNCDTVNVRVHVKGLTAAQVRAQIALHADGFIARLRGRIGGAGRTG